MGLDDYLNLNMSFRMNLVSLQNSISTPGTGEQIQKLKNHEKYDFIKIKD